MFVYCKLLNGVRHLFSACFKSSFNTHLTQVSCFQRLCHCVLTFVFRPWTSKTAHKNSVGWMFRSLFDNLFRKAVRVDFLSHVIFTTCLPRKGGSNSFAKCAFLFKMRSTLTFDIKEERIFFLNLFSYYIPLNYGKNPDGWENVC